MTHSADYKQLLREAGLRVTPQRTTIVSLLSETDDHPNVEDLYEKARRLDDTVSVATVYRTMSVLENAGLVRKLVLLLQLLSATLRVELLLYGLVRAVLCYRIMLPWLLQSNLEHWNHFIPAELI